MNKFRATFSIISLILICYFVYTSSFLFRGVGGHIFVSSDDNAAFLTLLERVRIEALLANESLRSNLTSSNEHIAQLLDRLDDVIDNENYFVVRSEQFNNATVDALFLANVVDEILQYYGGAYGILPNVMLNMSSMSIMGASSPMSNSTSSNAVMHMNGTSTGSTVVVDNNKYETAKQYAKRAMEIFDSELKPYETRQNSLVAGQVEKNLLELKNAVDNKAPPLDIMLIVHTKIHPNLQMAYNLKTRSK